MLAQTPDPVTGKVKVTFRLPAAAGATAAWVAGDWNDWSLEADPMKPRADGTFECTLLLEPGTYRFRYYLADERWENEWDADNYEDNAFGGADSVVIVRAD